MKVCISFFIFSQIAFNITAQEIDYSKFRGNSVSIHQSVQLDEPYIYDYEINSSNMDSVVTHVFFNNTAESKLIQQYERELAKNTIEENRYFIRLKSKLSYKYHGKLISIIKYQSVEDSLVSNLMVLQFLKKQGLWMEYKSSETKQVVNIFQQLSLDTFWQFYNKENNPKYPEINKLKPLVKDANGVLNVEKLAQVIKENKASLRKYLDE